MALIILQMPNNYLPIFQRLRTGGSGGVRPMRGEGRGRRRRPGRPSAGPGPLGRRAGAGSAPASPGGRTPRPAKKAASARPGPGDVPEGAAELMTPETDQAIDAGLAWLAKQQNADGSFGSGAYRATSP